METLVHCVAHRGLVKNGETVYVLQKNNEKIGVLCGVCMSKYHGSLQKGEILIFKGVTIPVTAGVGDCYPVGIPIGSMDSDELWNLGNLGG